MYLWDLISINFGDHHESLMDQIRRGTSLRRAKSTSDRSSPHFKHWIKSARVLFSLIISQFVLRRWVAQSGIYQVPLALFFLHQKRVYLLFLKSHFCFKKTFINCFFFWVLWQLPHRSSTHAWSFSKILWYIEMNMEIIKECRFLRYLQSKKHQTKSFCNAIRCLWSNPSCLCSPEWNECEWVLVFLLEISIKFVSDKMHSYFKDT